ncbi:nucleolin-like isoform X2 [Senna tora]|uniref:Nucleolin-like isoform X2 n=1 Tax=Senna tora TaxID=362788 RepID=A0A835C9Q0_9FABA|nr:nucleolin-like isoform X2 [Senna tora]
MEANQDSVTVTLNCGSLTCAAEALVTLLFSALFKTQLLAPDLLEMLVSNMPGINGEGNTQSQDKQVDAEEEDGNDDDGDDDDGDGGFGEGEEEDLSSEDGGGYGNNSNNKSNPKKAPEGGAPKEKEEVN